MKTNAERTVEALTWASVVIWLGFSLITHILGYPLLVVLVLGVILLSSAIYQRSQGWHTSLSIWIAGIWMAVFSAIEGVNLFVKIMNNGDGLGIDLWVYMGVALISMGMAVVLRSVTVPGSATGRQSSAQQRTSSQRQQTSYQRQSTSRSRAQLSVPRRVSDDTSSSYTSSSSRSTSSSQSASSSQDASWQPQEQVAQPSRRRAAPASRKQASRAPEPEDLETRVDDIIRRSRERRDRTNLPY
ncbi:MAG: hypothetical protein JW966_08250 [Anaerolineae bacterium]|nr:hypothetical protein [Anaerolineae bacterium]